MNKIYKVIWSKVKHQYVVVSELAHRDGKRSSTATTSKATWRALAAALMLTGSLAAMPYTGYAATGAETTSGQYIAVAVDSNNNSYKTGWWGHQETHYYKAGDTRTFEDANGDEHEYTWVSVDGKDYWVREGYSITIAESNRFDAYDENNNHIAPDKSYVIDSQKGENADDSGLISSSQVLVTDDKKHTTLTGNELNKIDAGIYGGAVNTGGTRVPVDYHYYIDDNGNGYINVGKKDNWSDFENSGHFKRVYYNEEKGVYQTSDGLTVSSEYLYAIDGTSTGRQDEGIASDVELGAFFNSDGTVYTGKVYGHNNEVLMTGYDEATDKYYSYWGTQVTDRKMSLANLTVGNLLDIKDGLEGSIYTAQGDDIKQVSVQKAQGSNNGGTIGFIRRGDYVGDDAEGNPIYKDTDPVPGTITIRNTDNSGKNGNDVAIRFGSIDEHGQDVQKFTVDAGSKVVGKIGESTATAGQTLDGISINGVDYKLGGGQKYTAGTNVDITDNAISTNDYRLVGSGENGTGSYAPNDDGEITLQVKDNKTGNVDNVKLTDIASAGDVTTNTKNIATNTTNITALQEADKLNVKYDSPKKDSVTLGGTGADNAVKLTNVANGVADTDAVNVSQLKNNVYDKYVSNAVFSTKTGKLDLTVANGNGYGVNKSYSLDIGTYIASKDDYVTNAEITKDDEGKDQVVLTRKNGGTVTMDISSLTGSMSTTDYRLIGSGEDGKGAYTPDDQGNITLKVKDDKTGKTEEVKLADIASATDVTKNTTNIGILQEADKLNVKYDSEAKETVTLGGTGSQTPVKLKNVAAGVDDTDAVNLSQLKNNVYDKYVSSATWDTGTGKLNLTVANGEAYGKSKEYSFDLGTYIADKDDYVTGAEVTQGEDGKDQVVLKRKNGGTVTMDISSLTGSMSTTDYRLIGSGEDGKGAYTPDDQGNITLKVKDDKTGKTEEVKLADIASATDVTKNTTNIGILQEADKLNVKYDSVAKNIVTLGGSTYDSETHEGGTTITNVADGKNASDAVNFSQLSEVKREAGKHTTIEPTGTNITVTQNSAEGEALNYTVDLNPVVTLDGTAGDDKQIVLDGNKGTISAENSDTTGNWLSETKTENTFDFDENGGTFTTTETTTLLGGIVQKGTMKHEATFDGDGATFTKSALSLSEGSEKSYTNIDGGTVTVQGDELLGLGLTNKTVIDGGTITVVGAGVTGGQTEIDGKHITAGKVHVNGEDGSTITGLSNTKIDYNGFGGGRAATEAQLDAMRTAISGDLKVTASDGIAINDNHEVSVNAGAGLGFSDEVNEKGTKELEVKVGSNLEINDQNQVDLKDNITLGAVEGPHIQLNGTPDGENNVVSIVDGNSNELFTIGQDGLVSSDGDVIADADGGKYSLSEVSQSAVRYDKNGDGTVNHNSVTLASTAPYMTVKDSAGHVISAAGGTTLKNVAYASGEDGSEAVNVDYLTTQLDKSQSAVVANERHIATSGDVNPDDGKQFSGEYYVNRTDGTISLIEVDGNGNPTSNTLVLKDIASATDLKNLDEGAVKYWRNEDGTYDKSYVELAGGEEGTVINHVADGKVNEYSKEAINGSQLWKVQELAGKHTTMTVNEGTAAPEDGSYTTDGNLQLKQTNTEGQIEYDVKLNDDIVLGAETGNNVSISGTNGTVSVTTGENTIHIGDGVITGLTNTTWNGTTTTPDRAATEGQLAILDEGAVKYWRNEDGTYDKSYVELAGGEEGTVINHVADGKVNEYSKEAINGSQLWEVQQEAKAQHTTMTVNGGTAAPADESYTDGNLQLQQTTGANGQIQYDVKLNDTLLLGGQNENNIVIDGTNGSILLNSRVDGEGVHSIDIDAASGTITGLTGALTNENWSAFMKGEGEIDDTQAATESDLRLVAQHSVQYYTDENGVIDYNRVVFGGTSYSNKSNGTMITNVAYAETDRESPEYDGSAAVNVDVLNDAVDNATATVTGNEKHIATNVGKNPDVAGGQFSVKDGKITLVEVNGNGETTGNTVVIDNVASASDLGDVTQIHDGLMNKDENGNNMDTSVVDAVNNLDDKVGSGDFTGTTHITNPGDTNLTDAIKDLDSAITNAQTEAGKHSTVSTVDGDKNIIVNDINTDPSKGANYQISLNKDLNVDTVTASGNIDAGSFSSGNITINKDNSGTINGLSNKTWDAAKDYSDSGMAATEAQLQKATEGAVQYDRNEDGTVNKDSITLGGSTYDPETHKGGTTITNVADGKNASDAVNMSQLWQTNQAVINNSNNISMLSNSVNKLDNRIDRVGAGAAALAALHPLDFDPDAKWDFAAGYGNYRGANAVAVGAYYRPNEDVMFSVGGSMGGGENMVNAGVSLKIGAGSSNVTTSRVAMAKEIKSMRDIVAKQDAQIQKLTAMVNALVGIQSEPDMTTMFPDVPENHWAYEAVEAMAKSGLVKGYPDGEFKGDRTMTRYEFAQIVYNAIQAGAEVDARLVEEFKPELEYFHIATVAKDKDGNPTIERVRAN